MSKSDARRKVSENAVNPLGGGNPAPDTSWEAVDTALYGGGGVNLPTIKKTVANGISIFKVSPDLRQPRRIIPANIRRGWTGDPRQIERMLREWHVASEKAIGEVIDVVLHIDRLSLDGRENEKTDMPPMVDDYLSLLALASSIKRDGLTNPITVAGDKIETGERRYMAHHLLNAWFPDEGFDTIQAVQVKQVDVWKQASENGNRKELNAIGMARQLALLIMDMYAGDDGVKFDDITFFDHEQQFYAQVSNGNTWRVKKGYGERILQVTGLKSRAHVNLYRGLLDIPRNIWDEADAKNWTEGRIRDVMRPRDTSTTVDISAQNAPTPIQNRFADFDRRMREALRQMVYRKPHQGFYAMVRGSHIFVGWNAVKNGYESVTSFDGREEAKMQYNSDVLISMMFSQQDNFESWNLVKRDDFMAMIRPPVPRNVPFTPSPTPTPSSVNRDKAFNDIVGDDDDAPYMPMDEDEAEALALAESELAQIKADAEAYKASLPPREYAPPLDFNETVFDNGSPQYVLAQAVKLWADMADDEQVRHVANMVMSINKRDIATWSGNWADVVGRWHTLFSEAVADMVNDIFNRLDAEGKK